MQELEKLIHRNLTPNNPVMLAMNRVQPPAKTPRDFYVKFLTVRAENRTVWHVANDLGFIKISAHSSHSNQNTDFSAPSSKQKRQKRGDEWRVKSHSSKPINAESCWTCGIKSHSRPQCSKSAHPDRNQENVPFLQSAIGKRWAFQFPIAV
jgi:hypothetical protein